ncbi:MAG: MBOAT family protein, partial [Clostridia bacterium]|nr:MBOAT family protein [Clostridia bacterium]
MAFNSLHFLIFFAIVLLLYYVLPHKCRWVLLLMASYYAYMCWNVALSLLIVGTTVVSYVSARIMEKTSNKALKKLCLVVTLVICLGVLVLFKYADFLLHSAASVLNFFGAQVPTVSLNLLLPIGISFYTFQTLSYVIDVYRGMPAEKHFGYYALFVSFFPQLVAGPIERPQNLIPQLKAHHKINNENMIVGLRYMLSGFFRKCVVADFCGVFVTNVFSNYQSANALAIVLGAWLFCVQVY